MSARRLSSPVAGARRGRWRPTLAASLLTALGALAAGVVLTLSSAGSVRAAPPAPQAMPPMHEMHAAQASTAVAEQPQPDAVDIRNFAFVPAQITVAAGTRVVWTNRDDEAHIVVSTSGAFKPSQALDTDDSFAMVFDKPGTYPYFCAIHPMMRGTVVVK